MQIHRKVFSVLAVFFALGIALLWLPRLGSASLLSRPSLPTPVAPEPYPNTDIYPALIYLANADDLQFLYVQRIDIGGLSPVDGEIFQSGASFTPTIATVYIDLAQSASLVQAGLTPIPIPNEGYRSFLDHGPGTESPIGWPTFSEYVARMQQLADDYPEIVRLQQIGTSVQGRGLFCLKITDKPDMAEIEPEFKYSANIHGDETTGIDMTMRLAELLASSYGTDPNLTDVVDKMEIWLCPISNPDGYVNGSRYNWNGKDINRNFPDRFTGVPPDLQPETQVFMDFESAHRFVMGANFHGGAQLFNYPWDAIEPPGDLNQSNYAPDDELFNAFGLGFTSRNPDLWGSPYFEHGITRGWEWYQIWGGMQDYDYYFHGEHHVTIEISSVKSPSFSQMDTYWNKNLSAMLWWLQRAWTGVGGLVLDARNNTPLEAMVTLVGKELPNTVLTDPAVGDYHRVVQDGIYALEASAQDYLSQSADVTVISGTVISKDFYLCPELSDLVTGTVTDAISGSPLQANIEFVGSRQTTVSNPETGHYSIYICPADYTMRVSAPWHYPEERQVNIDHPQLQDFALYPTPNLGNSTKKSSATQLPPEEIVWYQLQVENSGITATVNITDSLPISLTWMDELTATRGIPVFNNGQVLWQGEVPPGQPVTISYAAQVNRCLPAGTKIVNIAEFADGVNATITGKAQLEVLNSVPSTPSMPIPADGATGQSIFTRLSWAPSQDANCDQLTYWLAFGTVSPPAPIVYDLTSPTYDPGQLNPGTTYYWQVVALDGDSMIIGPVWSFTTNHGLNLTYLPLARK